MSKLRAIGLFIVDSRPADVPALMQNRRLGGMGAQRRHQRGPQRCFDATTERHGGARLAQWLMQRVIAVTHVTRRMPQSRHTPFSRRHIRGVDDAPTRSCSVLATTTRAMRYSRGIINGSATRDYEQTVCSIGLSRRHGFVDDEHVFCADCAQASSPSSPSSSQASRSQALNFGAGLAIFHRPPSRNPLTDRQISWLESPRDAHHERIRIAVGRADAFIFAAEGEILELCLHAGPIGEFGILLIEAGFRYARSGSVGSR